MREFMHGNEWWGLHDDGTWVRWNNQAMEWDRQAEAPPSAEMREVTRKPRSDVIGEQLTDSGDGLAPGASISEDEAVDPATGLPPPPGSKAYRWEFKKTFGPPPSEMPPGAKTFRWGFRKAFGPFPLKGGSSDPNASPEELRRTAFRLVSRQFQRVELWFALILALLFIGGLLLLLWVIDLGFHIG